ncbi:MAG: UDP-glucose 4-epimerase GalE [Congregibacter sp.]
MTQSRRVMLTGGAGYIGSHSCVAFREAGFEVALLDNLSNSSAQVIERLERILGEAPQLFQADIRDEESVEVALKEFKPDAVIHFAGLKAVGESVDEPVRYYDNNVNGTLCLLRAMEAAAVRTLVFSSSATVYGDPASVPIREDFPLSATNPYGRSKLMVEEILGDFVASRSDWRVCLLRYFNPVGAHSSGLIGENPLGVPNNLMPYVAQVAVGRLQRLSVYGDDYPTRDGTGVRDYIHVTDLAEGHVKALQALADDAQVVPGAPMVVNLGTGLGYSVLELVHAFEVASGRSVPFDIVPRRAGDIAECFADPSRARNLLGWEARFNLDRMCEDAWRWQSMNPEGFVES